MQHQPTPRSVCQPSRDVSQVEGVPNFRPLALRLASRTPGSDGDEVLAQLHLVWVEVAARHDASRGASALTYAWPRLTGRCADLRRAEARRLRLLQRLAAEPGVEGGAAPAALTGPRTDRIAMRQALQRVGPLSSAETLVLAGHYTAERSLGELAQGTHHSADSLQRAHRKLLGKLRDVLAAEPA